VNCCAEPARTSAEVGEIVKVPDPGVPGVREQPESIIVSAMTSIAAKDERRTVPSLFTWGFRMSLETLQIG
jgi:hypothetical protein